MTSTLVNLFLFLIGAGALLVSYLAFSPATRDLVVFLTRNQQIQIFRHRRILWLTGITALGVLFLRGVFGLADPASTGGLLAAGAELLGTAGAGWLILTVSTAAVLALAFWATYVPVVMAPPREQRLVGIEEADTLLDPDSIVLGLEMGDTVRAYPRDLIARPHWFNDNIGGKPLMISYCILCNSGQAFVPVVKGQRLDLRNMTAYDNNTVYHDVMRGNFIQQLDGRVIEGPDKGAVLESYPVVMASWREWKKLHPDTTVFYAPPQSLRDRAVDKMLRTMIPISKLARRSKPWHLMQEAIDDRLPAMSFVFGLELGGEACAYPVSALRECRVINDTVGNVPVVALYDANRNIGQIFRRNVGLRVLTFSPADTEGDGVVARDEETRSSWNVAGRATAGALKGQALESPPHYNQLFWFSWAAFKRGTRINSGENPPLVEAPRAAVQSE